MIVPVTGRTKVVAGTVVSIVTAIIAIVVYFHPIDVHYRLWRYRRDPKGFNTFIPQLCEKGNRVKPTVYEAFASHGKSTDIAAFRVAIAATLRCLRYREGRTVITEHVYQDLPEDPRLFDTIIRAFNQEPDETLRGDMLTYMWELDYRAHFAIYAGLLASPHPIPRPYDMVPSLDPYDHAGKRGAERDEEIAVRHAEWCKVISPVLQREYGTSSDDAFRRETIVGLGQAACSNADLRWLGEIAVSPDTSNAERATKVLASAARRKVPFARDTLVSLFGAPETCDEQVELYMTLKRVPEGVDRTTAIAILDHAEHCLTTKGCDAGPQPPCRDELIAGLVR